MPDEISLADFATPGNHTLSPVALNDENLDKYSPIESAASQYDLGNDAQSVDEAEADDATVATTKGLRWKLHIRRGDFYLALAIGITAVALLCPTGGEQRPELPLWERTLIAMGIVQADQPVAHFHGDPNLKVWVDTHTALYYCPGDELYGKSPDGHYSTQHEAQMDRFEPAERSVCIE